MRFVLLFAVSLLVPIVALADTDDSTLTFYLGKSDLVVLGTIKSEPSGISNEQGVVNYVCDFEVTDVLKGDMELKSKTIQVNIVRFEQNQKDHDPLITKDAECILFLKRQKQGRIPNWATADFWFGIQRPNPWMA